MCSCIGHYLCNFSRTRILWLFAFISTFIYTLLFWEGPLPMQAMLNFYYMGMAIYGFFLWKKQGTLEDDLPITSWSYLQQSTLIIVGVIFTTIAGVYLSIYQLSQNPYLDAGVTIFSVLNTGLMAKKVIQNWLYWIIIDAAAIMLYVQNGYYATVIMYCVYLILAIIGLLSWKNLYQRQLNGGDD